MLVTLDFETYYDSKVSLTKLTTMEYIKHKMFKVWGVGIKINDEPTEWFGEDEAEEAINDIAWADATLLCHNTPFDGYILTQVYGVKPAYYLDTAAMSRGFSPAQSARLAHVSERLFPDDESMRKGEELVTAKGIYDLPPNTEQDIAGYCIQDVDLTYAIYQKYMDNGYPQSELDLINLTTRMFCEPAIKIDRERLTKYHEQEFTNAEARIAKAGIDRKVLSSNQQFAAHIESLGLVVPTKRSPTTGQMIPALGKNDAGFKQLAKRYPEHDDLWNARTTIKSRLTETRAKRFLDSANDETDAIPVPLRYYAAHTGRFGGTEKLNMQNLPRGGELRRCLIAPEGQLLYVADLSNIEARMLAWLAGEFELLDQFRNGEDIYANFASVIYDKPITQKENPVERFVGKTAILGLGYGMGHEKFQATLKAGNAGPPVDFSTAQAKTIVNKYRSTYSGIKTLWSKLEGLLKQTMHKDNYGNRYGPLTVDRHSLIMPNGMALKYQDLMSTRQGLMYKTSRGDEFTYGGRITENVIQALSRIIITDSMLRLDKAIPNGKVVLTVHDEVIISAPNDCPDATMQKIFDDLCTPPEWALNLPLDVDGGYDTSYSK